MCPSSHSHAHSLTSADPKLLVEKLARRGETFSSHLGRARLPQLSIVAHQPPVQTRSSRVMFPALRSRVTEFEVAFRGEASLHVDSAGQAFLSLSFWAVNFFPGLLSFYFCSCFAPQPQAQRTAPLWSASLVTTTVRTCSSLAKSCSRNSIFLT